jgi:hypothetical protein
MPIIGLIVCFIKEALGAAGLYQPLSNLFMEFKIASKPPNP